MPSFPELRGAVGSAYGGRMIRITLATVLALPAVVLCTGIEHDRSTGAVISRPLALTECDASFGEQGNKLCPESHQVCAG